MESLAETGQWQPVYNLRIAEWHTYFVGDDEWGFSVWAHNAYDATLVKETTRAAAPTATFKPWQAKKIAAAMESGNLPEARRVLTEVAGVQPHQVEGILVTIQRQNARQARDAFADTVKSLPGGDGPGFRPATVTAGYHTDTGRGFAAGSGSRQCAEAHVVAGLGGDASKVRFVEAVRPRPNGPPFVQVPVCFRCEDRYGRAAFPADTTDFQRDFMRFKDGI